MQLLKLKKNAQLSTVEFLVGLLNNWNQWKTIGDEIEFFEFLNAALGEIKLSEKESFVLDAPS